MTIQKLIRIFMFADKGALHDDVHNACLLIDETSMVDMFLMHDILKLFESRQVLTMSINKMHVHIVFDRIVFTGDPNQLPSIRQGSILRDIMNALPTTILTEIHRQAQNSSIIHNAKLVLKGQSNFKIDDEFKIQTTSTSMLVDEMVRLSSSASVMLIVQGNPSVAKLNGKLQTKHNQNGKPLFIKNSPKNNYTSSDYVYRVGDPVFIIKPNMAQDCINGHKTQILGLQGDYVHLRVIDGLDPKIRIAEISEYLAPAYCGNVYKSQGQEADSVIFCMDWYANMQFRQMLYTAITRSKKNITIVTDQNYKLRCAINNQKHRDTVLSLLLST